MRVLKVVRVVEMVRFVKAVSVVMVTISPEAGMQVAVAAEEAKAAQLKAQQLG